MRDRSSIAATLISLEALVAVLLRKHIEGLDDEARQVLGEEIAAEAAKIGDEVVSMAPASATMSPDQAKAAAQRIQTAAKDATAAIISEALAE